MAVAKRSSLAAREQRVLEKLPALPAAPGWAACAYASADRFSYVEARGVLMPLRPALLYAGVVDTDRALCGKRNSTATITHWVALHA